MILILTVVVFIGYALYAVALIAGLFLEFWIEHEESKVTVRASGLSRDVKRVG